MERNRMRNGKENVA